MVNPNVNVFFDYHKILSNSAADLFKNKYEPTKIIVNGPATIVFWDDGTKTVVKTAKGESWDIYHAFTAALAKKVYGNNSRIHKILKTKVEWPDDFTLSTEGEE